jgi:SAM-dependent methyltransferase
VTVSRDVELTMVTVSCCVCDHGDATLVGTGYDYEYHTSPETFEAHQCNQCGTVYLNPRPDVSEFERIYPSEYHSLEFTDESFSFVHKVRSRLEARRLLRYCVGAPPGARILDIGCGDGFHLSLLDAYGDPSWRLEGIDFDHRAVEAARDRGLEVHHGDLAESGLGADTYDVVYTLQTIEHVANPAGFLRDINRILKPGGRLVIVTDNNESIDFSLFKNHYWGGYHFPRHWNLFNARSLGTLAEASGFEVSRIETIVSPVNWVYSIHNYLVGRQAPEWLVNRFTLKSPVSLAVFTLVDTILQRTGRGALLNGFFIKAVMGADPGKVEPGEYSVRLEEAAEAAAEGE